MPQGYSKELLEQYMKEEEDNENKKKQKQEQEKNAAKKAAAELDKTRRIAQLALEEVHQCRVEMERMHRSIKRNRLIAIVAVVAALICMAMVMGDELDSLRSMMP